MPSPPWLEDSYLGSLTSPVQRALLQLGRSKTWQEGDYLVRQGDPGGVVHLLLTGRVNVIFNVRNGTESLLAVRHPGDLIGEMAVFGGMPRCATVTARVPTITLVVSGEQFKRFVAEHEEATTALASLSAERLRQANTYRTDAAAYEVEQRLARTLLYQVERFATKIDGYWGADLRQAELAMLMGTKEGTVQKALRGMKDMVTSRRGKVIVLDVLRLAELADMEAPKCLR